MMRTASKRTALKSTNMIRTARKDAATKIIARPKEYNDEGQENRMP